MKTKTVSIDGEEFKIRRWTVGEQLTLWEKASEENLKAMKSIDAYRLQIEYTAQNVGIKEADIMAYDNETADLLWKEIVAFNQSPLGVVKPSPDSSTGATTQP